MRLGLVVLCSPLPIGSGSGQAQPVADQDLSKEHHLKPNIQVYTCLIHACFQNRPEAGEVCCSSALGYVWILTQIFC